MLLSLILGGMEGAYVPVECLYQGPSEFLQTSFLNPITFSNEDKECFKKTMEYNFSDDWSIPQVSDCSLSSICEWKELWVKTDKNNNNSRVLLF